VPEPVSLRLSLSDRLTGADPLVRLLEGALSEACRLPWRSQTRVCILIGDAPCHGSGFHEDGVDDRWPKGCPDGRDPLVALRSLRDDLQVDTCSALNVGLGASRF
jgi:hypothetical protein